MISAAEILAIVGEPENGDHFRGHLLFMRYTLGVEWMAAFHMADAEREFPLELSTAQFIAAHWREELPK